jgi:hypothetical protein
VVKKQGARRVVVGWNAALEKTDVAMVRSLPVD